MRYIQRFVTVFLLGILIINGKFYAFAINTGFSTEELSKQDIDTFLSNMSVTLLTEEPDKNPIECFDVNKNGLIAIGCDVLESKTVSVFNSDGMFMYGYKFSCSGTFGLEWDNENILIYLVRSNVVLSVTPSGSIEEVRKISDTTENNDYWNQTVRKTSQTVDNVEYTVRNNMGFFNVFASSYSQFVVTNSDGNEIVIYDVNKTQLAKMIVYFAAILGFALIVIVVVRKSVNQRTRGSSCTG